MASEQFVEFVDQRQQHIKQARHVFAPAIGKVHRYPARADVVVIHAKAGDLFEDPQGLFPQPVAVQHHRHCTDVHAIGGLEQHVRRDAVEFTHHGADPLRTRRNVDAKKLFGRHREHEFVEQWRGVVHAGDIGAALQVRQLFTSLFHACMEITNHRLRPKNLFALHLEDQAKDAVGRRVNRAHIYDHGLIAHGIDVERFDHFGIGLANAEDSAVIAASKNSLGGIGRNWLFKNRHAATSRAGRKVFTGAQVHP